MAELISLHQGNIQTLITQHIDLWTGAVKDKSSAGRGGSSKRELYGIKKLRELILELAVRGKLVAQDPNDEPASVLLERIAAEKAELIKQGKIKKPKKLPEISEDEKPFELPQGWSLARLGDVSTVITKGTTPTSLGYSFVSSGINFIKVENVNKGIIQLDTISQFIEEETHAALSRSALEVNDVLFSIAGTIGKTCLVRASDLPANTNQALAIIKGSHSVFCPRFLLLLLDSFVSAKTREKARGGAMPNVSLGDLNALVALVPSGSEQHRIVAKVDELMALCDQLEQQTESSLDVHQTLVQTLLDTLLQSTDAEELEQNWQRLSAHFDLLFTSEQSIDQLKQTILQLAVMGKLVPQDPNDEPASELLKRIAAEKEELVKQKKIKKQKPLPPISDDERPFQLPLGWEWCRLGELVSIRGGKRLPKGHSLQDTPTDYIYIRVSDMKNGTVSFDDLKYILPETHETIEKYIIESNDIYMTIVGATIGKCGLIPEKLSGMNLTENAARLTPFSAVNKYYLYVVLSSEFGQDQFVDKTKQVGVQKMALNRLATTYIPVPPNDMQKKVTDRVDQLMALCDQLKAKLADSKTTQLNLTDALVAQAVQEEI